VNYQRYDAIIADDRGSIPIEIKSPVEEEFLSVKAVRQALENKIVLLARKSHPAVKATTSLAVGYRLPNDRSEVLALIEDVRNAYGILIGVIDLSTLVRLVAMTAILGKEHDRETLRLLYGIAEVSDS
jgi:hypothetical protein